MIAACLCLAAVACCTALALVVRAEERAVRGEAAKASAIAVLGARVLPDGSPSLTLSRRIEIAAEAFHDGLAPLIIVCGGQGSDEPRSEADVMAEELVLRGVPEEHILRESLSTDTRENLRNARMLLAEREAADILIVTSDYHLARALYVANQEGLSAHGMISRTPDAAYRWLMRGREVLGWIKVFLNL